MKTEIQLTVDVANPVEVNAAIMMLNKFADTKPAKKKKVVKIETAEEEPAAPVEKEETSTEAPEKEETSSSEVTTKDLRALISKKVDAHRAAIKGKLSELGAKNVTGIKEEDYDTLFAFLNTLS